MEESPSFSTDGMLIAEWNGEPAGMVNAYVDKLREEKKGFIQWLGVLPKFRGNGIAKQLVKKALESLKQKGMQTAETWAQTDRKACTHIFESFGFKQVRATNMMSRSLTAILSNIEENREVNIREAKLSSNTEIKLINWLNNKFSKITSTIDQSQSKKLGMCFWNYHGFKIKQPSSHFSKIGQSAL